MVHLEKMATGRLSSEKVTNVTCIRKGSQCHPSPVIREGSQCQKIIAPETVQLIAVAPVVKKRVVCLQESQITDPHLHLGMTHYCLTSVQRQPNSCSHSAPS